MQAKWRDANVFQLPEHLKSWLLDPSSLTARLKQHCHEFKVEVLGQKIEQCAPEEATLDIHAGEEVLVREVLLYCDEKPHVFARSLLPLSSLTGEEEKLAHLGSQPLGQVLFNHPNLQRKCIEVASFSTQSSVARLAQACQLTLTDDLWGRRSTFVIDDKPLIVAEIFLPESFAYHPEKVY